MIWKSGQFEQWLLHKLYRIANESGSLIITYAPRDVHADEEDTSSPIVFPKKEHELHLQYLEWKKVLKIYSVPGSIPVRIQLLQPQPPAVPAASKQTAKSHRINLPAGTKWEEAL